MLTQTNETDGITILQFEGSLDALSVPMDRPQIDHLVERGGIKVIVDLSRVSTIDSSGVAIIVSLFKRLRAIGGAVRIAGVTGQPREIFHFLRLEQALALHASVDDAMRGF